MLSASLTYNHVLAGSWTDILRRIDLAAIYCKIAGTVTLFVLLAGTGTSFLVSMGVPPAPRLALSLAVGVRARSVSASP